MKAFTAQSIKSNSKEAVVELKEKFNSEKANSKSEIKAITFFASSNYEPSELINAMNDNFPNIQVWGCTAYGEIISGKMNSNSIVAMAFTDEIIEDIKIEVIDDTNIDVKAAINSFEDYYSTNISELDNTKYFGLICYCFSRKEEVILDELGEYSNIFLVGGTGSDDFTLNKVKTFANGKYYDHSTVVALIKSKAKFNFEKIHSFVPTEHTVTATKVDEANRIIYELNEQPAGEFMSKLVNVSNDKLHDVFSEYALGYMINGQAFLRALEYRGDNSILGTGCAIKQGMELVVMKNADIIDSTQKQLENIKKKYNSISAMLVFDCGYRCVELMRKNKITEYAKLFSNDIPTVGFYTYGETYLGHLNQTLVVLIFE